MKLFYKVFFILGILIFLSAVLLTLILTWKMPYNNLYLKNFQESFDVFIYPMHPKQSNLISETPEMGNWANGNQCQFIAGQFRISRLTKNIIKELYPKESMSSGVYFIDEDIFNHSPWSELKEKYLKYSPREGENIYLVWMSDDDKFSDGDIRCH